MKKIQHFSIESSHARAMFPVQILQHDISDRRDIFFMFTQRWNYDLEYTQPVVKFFAQMRSEFLTRRGKYASVYRDFVLAAKSSHSQLLENAQQFWLRRQ